MSEGGIRERVSYTHLLTNLVVGVEKDVLRITKKYSCGSHSTLATHSNGQNLWQRNREFHSVRNLVHKTNTLYTSNYMKQYTEDDSYTAAQCIELTGLVGVVVGVVLVEEVRVHQFTECLHLDLGLPELLHHHQEGQSRSPHLHSITHSLAMTVLYMYHYHTYIH